MPLRPYRTVNAVKGFIPSVKHKNNMQANNKQTDNQSGRSEQRREVDGDDGTRTVHAYEAGTSAARGSTRTVHVKEANISGPAEKYDSACDVDMIAGQMLVEPYEDLLSESKNYPQGSRH